MIPVWVGREEDFTPRRAADFRRDLRNIVIQGGSDIKIVSGIRENVILRAARTGQGTGQHRFSGISSHLQQRFPNVPAAADHTNLINVFAVKAVHGHCEQQSAQQQCDPIRLFVFLPIETGSQEQTEQCHCREIPADPDGDDPGRHIIQYGVDHQHRVCDDRQQKCKDQHADLHLPVKTQPGSCEEGCEKEQRQQWFVAEEISLKAVKSPSETYPQKLKEGFAAGLQVRVGAGKVQRGADEKDQDAAEQNFDKEEQDPRVHSFLQDPFPYQQYCQKSSQ